MPELRPLFLGPVIGQGVKRFDRVCAVPARLCDLVPAYDEKYGLDGRVALSSDPRPELRVLGLIRCGKP